MSKPTDFNIQTVIDDLQGTCNTLSDALPEGMDDNDLTAEDHNAIDNQVFHCEQCGWWCEVSEAHEGSCGDICDDCYGEDNED